MFELIKRLAFVLLNAIVKLLVKRGIIFSRYYSAFGHQAWNLEHYSRSYQQIYGRSPKIIAFQRSSFIPNRAMYQRHKKQGVLIFGSNSVLTKIFIAARTRYTEFQTPQNILASPCQSLTYCRYSNDDIHVGTFVNEEARIAFPFSPLEERKSLPILKEYGLTKYQYVCFQDRTIQYKKRAPLEHQSHLRALRNNEFTKAQDTTHPAGESSKEWWFEVFKENRHDYARNTSLSYLYQAANFLHEQQIESIRVGTHPEQPAKPGTLIDYATLRNPDHDFSDLALFNYCKFFVGPNSGLWLLARSLNKPVCLINAFPWPWINVPFPSNSMVMPKKLWHVEDKKFLTIYDMAQMENRYHWKSFKRDEFYDQIKLEIIENSAEEIRYAVEEMNSRLDGDQSYPEYRVSKFLESYNIAKETNALFPSFFVEENPDIFPQSK
jgi:putative glycosyltransferase (TIGR04372 family)